MMELSKEELLMLLTEEDLFQLSNMMDEKVKPLERRLKRIEVNLLENNVIPRLNTIENCYLSTYERYKNGGDKMETIAADVEMMKTVMSEHSQRLQKLENGRSE